MDRIVVVYTAFGYHHALEVSVLTAVGVNRRNVYTC